MLSGEVLVTVENWYFPIVDQGCLNFQTWFRSWNRARSSYWICWWRCDNASRKGKAMTISSYSLGSEWSHPRVIKITLLSAHLLWNGLCGSLALVTMLSVLWWTSTLHSCFRGNKNRYGFRSCELFFLLSPVGEWVTQWKRGEEVTSQPRATLHSYDSISQDLRFGFYAFHLC